MNTPYIPSKSDISDLKEACGYPQKAPRPDLNDFAARCHAASKSWWHHPVTGEPIERNPRELLMLAISEIAEAMEGERKNLMDDHLHDRKMAEVEMADYVIRLADFAGGMKIENIIPHDTVENMPDNKGQSLYWLCRHTTDILDRDTDVGWDWDSGEEIGFCIAYAEAYCEKHGYDLWAAVECKLRYNQYRADHKPENRVKEGGKSF